MTVTITWVGGGQPRTVPFKAEWWVLVWLGGLSGVLALMRL